MDENSLGRKLIDNQKLKEQLNSINPYSLGGKLNDNKKIEELLIELNGDNDLSIKDICSSLEGINVVLKETTIIPNDAFHHKNLLSISGNLVTEIGNEAFYNCALLATVNFPSLKIIGENTFCFCGLKKAVFKNAETVGASAFQKATDLELVDLAVSTLEKKFAFHSCFKLQTLILRSSSLVPLLNQYVFYNTPLYGYNGLSANMYVPNDLIASYQSASWWSSILSNGHTTIHAIEGSEYE